MTKKNNEIVAIETKTSYRVMNNQGQKLPAKVDPKTGEVVAKNAPFYQFTKDTFPHILSLMDANPFAARVFMFMVSQMNDTNALLISYTTLEEIFGKSRRTLSRAIKDLVEGSYIQIQKSGNMNIYCINAAIVWTKSRNQIYRAKFNATVIISETEQDYEVYKERLPVISTKSSKKKSDK